MFKQICFPYTNKRTRHRSVVTVLGRCMCHKPFVPMAEGYITQFLVKLANQRLAKAHAFVDIMIVVPLNLGFNRCGSSRCFPHPTLSLATVKNLNFLNPRGSNEEVRRVDLANWALRTSPKFTTGVKYQFHQGFWSDQRSRNAQRVLVEKLVIKRLGWEDNWIGFLEKATSP